MSALPVNASVVEYNGPLLSGCSGTEFSPLFDDIEPCHQFFFSSLDSKICCHQCQSISGSRVLFLLIKYLLKVDVLQIQSNIDITLTMCNLYFLSNFESFNDGRFTLGYISRSMFLRYYSNEHVVVVMIVEIILSFCILDSMPFAKFTSYCFNNNFAYAYINRLLFAPELNQSSSQMLL